MDSKKAIETVLSILPIYLRMRWALIVDTNKRNLRFVYPENPSKSDLLENFAAIENHLEQRHEHLQTETCVNCKKDDENTLVYLTIDSQHALIVDVPPDIPIQPVEEICEHVKLILKQTLETIYEDSTHQIDVLQKLVEEQP